MKKNTRDEVLKKKRLFFTVVSLALTASRQQLPVIQQVQLKRICLLQNLVYYQASPKVQPIPIL